MCEEGPSYPAVSANWRGVWVVIDMLLLAVASAAVWGAMECCDPNLRPIDNPVLQYRKRAERCEGFYEAEVASGDALEVVGLTHGVLAYSETDDASIVLDCPFAPPDSLVRVRAVGVPLRMYYRMDALLKAGQSLSWPLDEVIHLQRIRADDVAIAAWVGESEGDPGQRLYVPVRAVGHLMQGALDDPVVLYIRPTVDVEAVQWHFAVEEDGLCGAMGEWTLLEQPECSAGRQIRIEIDSSRAERRICVEVAARTRATARWLFVSAVLLVGNP